MPEGVPVHRMDFPYRKAGRRAPDRQPVLVESVIEEAEAFCKRERITPANLFLGGRSMGGRMCSLAIAEGLPAAGLVLISYPLHPPGKPEKLRVEHFKDIDVPALFISGTRDSFGSKEEFRKYLRRLRGPKQMKWIEGGDHGLKKFDNEVAAMTKAWIERHVRQE